MKGIKKLVSIMLCLLLVVSLFTACKKDETGENTDIPAAAKTPSEAAITQVPADASETAEPEEAEEVAAAASEVPLELTLGIWPADNDTAKVALQEGYVREFNALHPDITVVPAHYNYSRDNFTTLAKAGLLPVVFETYYEDVQRLIESGYAADITDILEARGWLSALNPYIKGLMSKDGKCYGTPCGGYALGLMLNTALFKKAGLVDADGLPMYPKTFTELASAGKKIKEATGAAGFCLLAEDNAAGWQFTNIAWAFGAELTTVNDDSSATSGLDSPEAIAAMEYVKDLKWKYDILTKDPAAENWSTGFAQLGTGAAAMYIAANDAVDQPTYVNGLPAGDLSLVPMPAGPGGDQYSLFGGSFYMFSKSATKEQINAALDYLAIMGKGPVPDKDAYEADCKDKADKGIPVIYRFPDWTDRAGIDEETKLITQYSNVDLRLYQDYFDIIKKDGNLRLETQGDAMYQELTAVLQAVIKDENADVAALMKQADENYQKFLDSRY